MDLWNLGKDPVSVDRPEGVDIRYDPEFEQLQAEMDKLSSPSAAGGVDWLKVSETAAALLANKSKDLMVASNLAVALMNLRRAEGLAMGLRIYRDLLSHFWETLHPPQKRMRGRVRTIEWWIERTQVMLPSLDTTSLDASLVSGMKEDFETIDGLLAQYLEEAPSMASLRDFLHSIAVKADDPAASGTQTEPGAELPTGPGAAPPPDAPREPEAQPLPIVRKEPEKPPPGKGETRHMAADIPPPRGPSADSVEDVLTVRGAQKELNACLQSLRKVAAALWQEDAAGLLAYRLNRTASWLQVVELPQAVDGRTRVPPPDLQFRNMLGGLLEKEAWENLLKSVEPRISQFPLWLDLNRHVASALGRLGKQYEAARETVRTETACFAQRCPGMEDLTFSDGMPFADEETKNWLREGACPLQGYAEQPLEVATRCLKTESDGNPAEDALERARTIAGQGNLPAALELLQNGLRSSSSCKESFSWRLALAELLIRSKNASLVAPHIERILTGIEEYRLESWDPELAANALKVAWAGLRLLPEQAGREKVVEIFSRIAALDPAGALGLEK